MAEIIIKHNKSVIVSADVESSNLSNLIEQTCLVEGIGGYKIGFTLGLEKGLPEIVKIIREHTNLPIIYDHQKAGNDIPAMGEKFAEVCKSSGIDTIILFPFAGEETEKRWIRACKEKNLNVIVGAHMTHPKFLNSDGGFLDDNAPAKIFSVAMREGVKNFVVPGNNLKYVEIYKNQFERILGKNKFTLFAPGFITQGGDVSDFSKVAGNNYHAIVGSGVYKAKDMKSAAENIVKQIK